MGKTKDLFMKIGDTKGKIHTKIKHNKGKIQKGPNRGRRLKKVVKKTQNYTESS